MRTNIQAMQGGMLMVKRFQMLSKLVFPLTDPDLDYWYIIWKVNTTNRGLNLKKTFCILCLWGWGFHVKPVFFFFFFFLIIAVTYSLMSWLWGCFRFMYLQARLMEKQVKVLHSESEGSWLKPRLPVTLGSNKYQTQWLRWG